MPGLRTARAAARVAVYLVVAVVLLALPFAVDRCSAALGCASSTWRCSSSCSRSGLNIVVGFAGLLDLGYVAFFAVGAYLYALLASPHFGIHWPSSLLLPLGAAVACVFGVLLGAPTLRLRGDYLAIVTLGFGEIIRIFLNNLNRPVNITNGPQGITLIDPIRVGGFSLRQPHASPASRSPGAQLLLSCSSRLHAADRASRSGSRTRASGAPGSRSARTRSRPKSMGINTRNVKLLAFAMGATFGGLSGGLFAAFQGFVSPESFALIDSIMILCMVVLGGMGHVPGRRARAQSCSPRCRRRCATSGRCSRQWLGRVLIDPSDLRMLLFGFALVLMMLFRPAGLWPSRIAAARAGGELDGRRDAPLLEARGDLQALRRPGGAWPRCRSPSGAARSTG